MKKLTVAELRKQDKKFNERKPIYIGDYYLEIDKEFRPTKISQMIAEMIDKIQLARQNGYQIYQIITPYSFLMTIKYFTSFSIPDEFGKQLQVMELLIDNDFLEEIINNLPEDQMLKVNEQLKKVTENIDMFADEFKKMNLQNKDVLNLEGEEVADI